MEKITKRNTTENYVLGLKCYVGIDFVRDREMWEKLQIITE